ncbi:glutaredoxin family protein [Cellulomonas sp. ES6]|uniref:glutaredoxin family protein n=1 Tax=Cellulomonas sp. ES6 TaxID=3039384 RepID=UPI0024B727E2|nr:glutaredoxin family protein [Cellulomonas sp. ES6]WHP16620.1 glutaredoxin family protein [Cellulomonas sp. ES6]
MPTTPPDLPVITVVQAPACHFCDDAKHALAALAEQTPLLVRVVDIDSDAGRALVAEHRPAMNPLVLLDGRYFSSGRLPRRKLAKALEGRTG